MSFRKLTFWIATAGASVVAGNYLYACCVAPHDWAKAFEHSFFQVVAVMTVWLIVGINSGFGKQSRSGPTTVAADAPRR